MKPDSVDGMDRELVSDFVRKRIAALNAARSILVASPRVECDSNETKCGDTCSPDGACSVRKGALPTFIAAISDSDTTNRTAEAHADTELQHMGCPICIACFAGILPNEQVPFHPLTCDLDLG